jgi:hypothetical protein
MDQQSEDDSEYEELSFETICHRTRVFRKVLDYKPTSRVVPDGTYLAIVMYGTCLPLYMRMRYHNKKRDKDIENFTSIERIVLVPRPVNGFMSYCISDLHVHLHGSIEKGSEQEDWFKEATSHIDVVTLREGENYDNESWGIKVLYQDAYLESFKETFLSLLPCISKLMPDTSVSGSRKIPAVSCGWSTANPHLYKHNRTNIIGGIRPFLIESGVPSLPTQQREKVAAMMCRLVKNYSPCWKLPSPFFHSDPGYEKARFGMATEFIQSLGANVAKAEGIDNFFKADGASFIFNNFVSFHKDSMNDYHHGLTNTLSYIVNIPISGELANIPSVKKAMKLFHLQVGDPLSFGMLLYSRRVVLDFVRKELKIQGMIDGNGSVANNPSRFLISPLLKAISRVNSDMNTNAIWDDPSIMDSYKLLVMSDKNNTQYSGSFCPIVAGFDKMRYWSPVRYLADVLHARGIVAMTTQHMMGYVCFAALETNGTFLLSGIIDDAMCCVDPRQSTFVKQVHRYGMYAALIFAGHRKNRTTGTGNIYGSSKLPRHQHHNRGSSTFPIAGNSSLSFEDKDGISLHCSEVVRKLLGLCSWINKQCYDIRMKVAKRGVKFETVATEFYEEVKNVAGKGVGHIFALNFCQVAALFGFMPMEMVSWATVKSKTSGAYKAINAFYKKSSEHLDSADLSEEVAEKHFEEAVSWISLNVGWNFTHALAENILCELHRENCEDTTSDNYQQSPKKDVLYMYTHRRGVLHHLYRWKNDIKGRVILQALIIRKDGTIDITPQDLMVMKRDSLSLIKEDNCWFTAWDGDKYDLSPEYCEYLL